MKLPDLRCKIQQDERKKIKDLYNNGVYNMSELASMYNVHKSTILKIVNPEYRKKIRAINKFECNHIFTYNKDKKREEMRLYRARRKAKLAALAIS